MRNISRALKNSLAEWHQTGVRGVWYHVSGEETEWIPDLLREGFYCHHAKKDNVMGFYNNLQTNVIYTKLELENRLFWIAAAIELFLMEHRDNFS